MTWLDYAVRLIAEMPSDKHMPLDFGGGSDWWQTADSYLLSDHDGENIGYVGFAYSLLYAGLTQPQRDSIYHMMTNGYMNTPCDSRLQRRAGRITTNASNNTITIHDASWHSDIAVGKWIAWRANSNPAYATGTVTVTNGSSSVVGVGTAWTTAMTGFVFSLPGDPANVYTMTYVNATHLTLDRAYAETTAAGVAYIIGSTNDSWTQRGTIQFDHITAVNGNTISVIGLAAAESYGGMPPIFSSVVDGYYFTFDAWDETRHCGMAQHMSYNRPTPSQVYISERQRTTSSLSALPWPITLGGVTTTVTVDKNNWTPQNTETNESMWEPSPTHPWNALIWDDAQCGSQFCGYSYPEYVNVIGRSGSTLTIIRGKYTTAPRTLPSGSTITVYTGNPEPQGPMYLIGSPLENNQITAQQNHIMMQLAFADYARVQVTLPKILTAFYNNQLVAAKNLFTIWNYSGIGYGQGRGNMLDGDIENIQNSFSGIDYWGTWESDRLGLFGMYLGAPWSPKFIPPWGFSANGGCVIGWGPFCPQGIGRLGAIRGNSDLQFQQALYWAKNISQGWAAIGWENPGSITGTSLWQEFWPAMFVMTQFAGDTAAHATYTDYRSTLSPSRIWSKPDSGRIDTQTGIQAGVPVYTGHGTVVSKAIWANDASQLWVYALAGEGDKYNGVDPITTYSIGKGSATNGDSNGFLITHDVDISVGMGPTSLLHENTFDFGYLTNSSNISAPRPVHQDIRGTVKPEFTYARVNKWQAYALNQTNDMGVTRAYQNFVHLKTGKEFIVVHDDTATSASQRFRSFVHYVNNGETLYSYWNGDTLSYTEGLTTHTAAFGVIDSRGPVSKLLTTWQMPGKGTDWKVYDVSVREDANEYLNAYNGGYGQAANTFHVNKDCSVSAPCTAYWHDGTTYSYTSSKAYSITAWNGNIGGSIVRVWIAKSDGSINVRPSSSYVHITCDSGINCLSPSTDDYPADAIRLARHEALDWNSPVAGSGAFMGRCPGPGGYQTGQYIEWGSCVGWDRTPINQYNAADTRDHYGIARVVFFDAGTTAEGQIVVVHRPTAMMDETADTQTTLTVTGTGGNFIGTQIDGSDPALVITPKGIQVGSGVAFAATHTGNARLVVCGLAEGNYRVLRDGVAIGSYVVDRGENALWMTGVGPGMIEVVRSVLLPLRVDGATRAGGDVGKDFALYLSVSGGAPPYHWSVSDGALPAGVTLSDGGVISGKPAFGGRFSAQIRVTDSSVPALAATLALQVTINVQPNPGRWIRAVAVMDRAALLEYGGTGLAAQDACTVTVSRDASLSPADETLTDTGGRGVRRAVVGISNPLAPGQTYFMGVQCGASGGAGGFSTLSAIAQTVRSTQWSEPAPANATQLVLEYGPTQALGSSIVFSCAGQCQATVTAPVPGLLFVRRTFLDAQAREVFRGEVQPVVVR